MIKTKTLMENQNEIILKLIKSEALLFVIRVSKKVLGQSQISRSFRKAVIF